MTGINKCATLLAMAHSVYSGVPYEHPAPAKERGVFLFRPFCGKISPKGGEMMTESQAEHAALEFAKQIVITSLQNSGIIIIKENGKSVGEYFDAAYEKSLEVFKKVKDYP